MLPDRGLGPLAFDQIRRSRTGNDLLYADRKDLAANLAVDGPALSIQLAPKAVLARTKMIAAQLGADLRNEGANSLFFVWRSPAFGFPNGAYVYAAPEGQGSRISLYGRALYGRRDFGANKGFIDQLVAALSGGS